MTTNTFAPHLPPLTVEQYLALDRIEPWEIGGWAEIAADTTDWTFWFIGVSRDGSLARTDLNLPEYLNYPPHRAQRCRCLLNRLPRMWLLSHDVGQPAVAYIGASHRAKIADVPPPESASPRSPGPHDDEEPTTSN